MFDLADTNPLRMGSPLTYEPYQDSTAPRLSQAVTDAPWMQRKPKQGERNWTFQKSLPKLPTAFTRKS